MTLEQEHIELLQNRKAKKFNLIIGMIGMFMMFAALSSGFIVYTASGVDKGIKTILPTEFIYSTIVLLASSITVHFSFIKAKQDQLIPQRVLLLSTIVLGIVFFALQYASWSELVSRGIYFVNTNASQSFIYIFTGLHLAHIVAGIIVLIICLYGALKPISAQKNQFRTELATIFWHFLDLLWIYIYVFLLLNQ